MSMAVTVRPIVLPAMADPTPGVTVKDAAAAGLTVMLELVPVIVLVTVSVAVTVQVPTVLSVTEKELVPLARVALAGRTAAPSVEVKWTVPG